MPSFRDEFVKSKGQPIIYKGQKLFLTDQMIIHSTQKIKLVIESSNSIRRQGVALEVNKGSISYKNHELKKNNNSSVDAYFWADENAEYEVMLKNTDGTLMVWNYWEHEYWNGQKENICCTNGAAMIVEEISNGRRYRCNDVEPDEDFDDLIFRIELLG